MTKPVTKLLVLAVFAGLLIIYGKLNPETSNVFPACPFKSLTGLECPGCGSQRAIHHLLNLHVGSAFAVNALMVLSIPYILLLVVADFFKNRSKFFMQVHTRLQKPMAIWILLIIVGSEGLIRTFSTVHDWRKARQLPSGVQT